VTRLELTQRAVLDGHDVLKDQLERMLAMAQHKPSTTKRSGSGSKKRGSKKLRKPSGTK
jgi:hypothetical protein